MLRLQAKIDRCLNALNDPVTGLKLVSRQGAVPTLALCHAAALPSVAPFAAIASSVSESVSGDAAGALQQMLLRPMAGWPLLQQLIRASRAGHFCDQLGGLPLESVSPECSFKVFTTKGKSGDGALNLAAKHVRHCP